MEKFFYSKEDVIKRLEEIHKASLKFVTVKDEQVMLMIITALITESFYEDFKIDFWRDSAEYGTRFRDLIELSLMYKQAKTFLRVENQTEVSFEMGATLMQDIANLTVKLYKHRYES